MFGRATITLGMAHILVIKIYSSSINVVSDIVVFVLKRDVKLQLTIPSYATDVGVASSLDRDGRF